VICPECGSEYQPDFTECAGCQVALVEPGAVDDSAERGDEWVPLTREWGRDYALSVVIALLQNAGFHPMIDCDPRGGMHYYGWPFASQYQTVVWVPESEVDEARAFLEADCEPSWGELEPGAGFYALASDWRPWLYLAWIFDVVGFGGFMVAGQAVANSLAARSPKAAE